jgi:hypothetical protein
MKMLRAAIEACPEGLWNRDTDHNRFWIIAYHTVFYAHLYASPSEERFEPFTRHGDSYGHLGDGSKLTADDVRSKQDVLAFWDHVDAHIEALVASTPFEAPSGFDWLPFSRGETHLYSLRHIQHHAGQLSERLRQEEDIAVQWVGKLP